MRYITLTKNEKTIPTGTKSTVNEKTIQTDSEKNIPTES